MAFAFGHGSNIIAEWETTYGTQAGGTSWKVLPVQSFDFGATKPWEPQDVVGLVGGRDAPDPLRGLLTVEPSAEVMMDLINFGYWLRLILGDPSTSGSSDYTHVFKSGGATPRSLSIEHGNAYTSNGYQVGLGIRGNTLEMRFRPGDVAQMATISMMGLTMADRTSSSADASPTLAAWTPFTGPVMTATRAGSAIKVTGATVRISNNLEAIREANRANAGISAAVPSVTEVSGSVDVRLQDDTLLADSEGSTPVALAFGYSLSETQSLAVAVPEAYLDLTSVGVRGRAGLQATFNFRAAYNASAACAMSATIINQQAAYT